MHLSGAGEVFIYTAIKDANSLHVIVDEFVSGEMPGIGWNRKGIPVPFTTCIIIHKFHI